MTELLEDDVLLELADDCGSTELEGLSLDTETLLEDEDRLDHGDDLVVEGLLDAELECKEEAVEWWLLVSNDE
ncbi:hypothetical protein IMSHALPRED_009324 [Imshaugia aleurites]|uniref:Uncharacterized protein n=1 Tax=Imshaugia aleurites TaxID=172621 RepID=A0A8H3IYS1_9LECA|nr:hypothetical protein IMSHALPRED_009324 [Imshaugia aleurites]